MQDDSRAMSTTNNMRHRQNGGVRRPSEAQAGLTASQRKVSFELGVEGSGGQRLTPGSPCLTSLTPSFLCKRGQIMLASPSGLLRGIH